MRSVSDREDWPAALRAAFEILLRRPLDAYDPEATYALYHWDDILNDEFFEAGHTMEELHAPESRHGSPVADTGEPELDPDRWAFDLGRSVFEVDDWELPVREQLHRVRLPAKGSVAVLGGEFGRVLVQRDVSFAEVSDELTTVLLRVVTDGSLFDAMRAATWTMSAPEGLVPFREGAEVDERWRTALDPIEPPALRQHMRMLCLTAHWARSDGAHYIGRRCPDMLDTLAKLPGHAVVAGWEFGEGQAASAIVQMTAPRTD